MIDIISETLRWYATRSACGCGCRRQIHQDAGRRARSALLGMGRVHLRPVPPGSGRRGEEKVRADAELANTKVKPVR